MNKRIIQVISYNPIWPESFKSEAERLSVVLGDNLNQIDHIGSTAVPGLSAKPIIDILASVNDFKVLDSLTSAFIALGYEVKGEFGIEGRRYFQKGGNNRTHHLHVYQKGDEHLTRHIAFRDYLIANNQVAKEYQFIKEDAARKCANDSAIYQTLKNDFIKKHERIALQQFT